MVAAILANDEIPGSVIQLIAVNVMNFSAALETMTDRFLSDQYVL